MYYRQWMTYTSCIFNHLTDQWHSLHTTQPFQYIPLHHSQVKYRDMCVRLNVWFPRHEPRYTNHFSKPHLNDNLRTESVQLNLYIKCNSLGKYQLRSHFCSTSPNLWCSLLCMGEIKVCVHQACETLWHNWTKVMKTHCKTNIWLNIYAFYRTSCVQYVYFFSLVYGTYTFFSRSMSM